MSLVNSRLVTSLLSNGLQEDNHLFDVYHAKLTNYPVRQHIKKKYEAEHFNAIMVLNATMDAVDNIS